MDIGLDALLAIAGTEPEQFAKIGELARRLNAIEQERREIIASLAEFGIVDQPKVTPLVPPVLSRVTGPPCATCGVPAEMEVDGRWFCERHGDEQIAGRDA